MLGIPEGGFNRLCLCAIEPEKPSGKTSWKAPICRVCALQPPKKLIARRADGCGACEPLPGCSPVCWLQKSFAQGKLYASAPVSVHSVHSVHLETFVPRSFSAPLRNCTCVKVCVRLCVYTFAYCGAHPLRVFIKCACVYAIAHCGAHSGRAIKNNFSVGVCNRLLVGVFVCLFLFCCV